MYPATRSKNDAQGWFNNRSPDNNLPIKGENEAIVGASSIVRDITSEKVEQHIREHENQYRTLVEDLKVGIYRSTGDPRGRFVWEYSTSSNSRVSDHYRSPWDRCYQCFL